MTLVLQDVFKRFPLDDILCLNGGAAIHFECCPFQEEALFLRELLLYPDLHIAQHALPQVKCRLELVPFTLRI